MNMLVITASIGHAKTEECITSWGTAIPIMRIDGTGGMLEAYQRGYEESEGYDVLAYIHDDVLIREPNWHEHALKEFEDEKVGVVGFGGALVHGSPDLYKRPYNLQQLGRAFYLSNVDDAEVHGARFTGSSECAVLDGFALIVRRSLLGVAGGWPLATPIGYSLYDYWLCAMAHRLGLRVRVIGIRCHHFGGLTSVGLKVIETDGMAHVAAHRYIAEQFKDVLPYDSRTEVIR